MSDEFRVGVASVDISPERPELLTIGGLHRTLPTVGVLEGNGLWVDAMAFQAGGRTAVVATRDTGGFGRRSQVTIAKAVVEATGIDDRCIIITGRHNHSCGGGPADKDNPECVKAADEHWQKIERGTVEACVKAIGNLRPAEIAAATAPVTEPIGQCRRMRFGHGACMPSWGTGPVAIPGEKFAPQPSPDATRIDFLVAREVGKVLPFGILTSYPSHIHLSSIPYFTGEAVGGIKQALRDRIPGVTVVYGTATGGDLDMHCVHPIPPGGPEVELRWFRDSCRALGERFAEAFLSAIPTSGYVRPDELRQESFSTEGQDERRTRLFMVNAIRLGDIAMASIPAEMFIDLVNKMHAESPLKHLLLLGFNASGWLGYIGTPLAYEQGSYEVARGPAPSPEEEQRMIDAGIESRVIGRARIGTGIEITDRVREVLTRLAR